MKKIIYLTGIIGAMLVTLLVLFNQAKANPSYFTPTVQTATATTSPSYMTPGTSTTTLTFDSHYVNTLGNNTKADSAVLLTQFAGSSTASTLHLEIEYSQDGVDWYRDNLMSLNGISTTTQVMNVSPFNSMDWKFASSTVGGKNLTAASGATSTKAIIIPTPTRYVRVVYSLNIVANGSGAVWAQIVPSKQRSE